MSQSPINDAQLELLFKKNFRSLCMVSYSLVKDMDAAKDIVQDFFIKFWGKYKNAAPPEKFEAYAFTAVKNISLNYISSAAVREKRENSLKETFYEEKHSQQEAAEEQRANFQIAIMKTINELPDQRRKIFIMSSIEGKKYADIAEQLNISVNTVKTQIRKAYQYIRSECSNITWLLLIISVSCNHPIFKFAVIYIVS